MSIKKYPWAGRVFVLGKLHDVRLVIEFDPNAAGAHLARRAAKTRRRRAVMCFGTIRADITEMQQVIE